MAKTTVKAAAGTTDQKTLDLIKEVARQRAEIAQAEKPNWRTNCNFAWVEGKADVIVLHVEKDIKKLIQIAAFLAEKEESYLSMAAQLGVSEAPPFTWNGYGVGDWIEDIKTRINKIQINVKKSKFEALEERLNKIISPELRAQMELEAIAAELSK